MRIGINKTCSGLMLTDVMLTISLGLLLASILFEMYLAAHKSLTQQHDLLDMQNTAAAVMDILSNEIRQAGYIGCLRLDDNYPVISHLPFIINESNRLVASESGAVTIRYAGSPAALTATVSQDRRLINVSNNRRFSAGDVLLISDCRHAELARADKVYAGKMAQKISLDQQLQFVYEKNAEVSELVVNTFYLDRRNSGQKAATNVFSLMMRDIKGNSYELVTGITHLGLLYSVHDAGVWKERAAKNIVDWRAIGAVAINLETYERSWHAFVRVGAV